jgi:hypothetical protein
MSFVNKEYTDKRDTILSPKVVYEILSKIVIKNEDLVGLSEKAISHFNIHNTHGQLKADFLNVNELFLADYIFLEKLALNHMNCMDTLSEKINK